MNIYKFIGLGFVSNIVALVLAIIGKQPNNNIPFSQLCLIIFNISKNVHDDDQEMVSTYGASSNSTGC